MSRTIQVFLGDTPRQIGVLRFDAHGARESAGFEYHPTWLAAEDAFALEPNLPLLAGMQYHKKSGAGSVFHGAVADTEPDGWARRVILRDHAKQRDTARRKGATVAARALDSLDFLLAVDDTN